MKELYMKQWSGLRTQDEQEHMSYVIKMWGEM